MSKINEGDTQLLASFMYFGLMNEFAKIDEDFRFVMISFKIHSF